MKWLGVATVAIGLLVAGFAVYQWRANARVVQELHDEPQGARAQKTMVLTLPSGKAIPVNYLRDGETVYAAADFPWWRELRGGGGPGQVMIRGQTLPGHVRAVEDDPELRDSVFERLRPTAPRWTGTLVVVDLD